MSDLTELQRCILRTAYNYPNYAQKDIAESCNCSPSYVSQTLGKYDSFDMFHTQVAGLPGMQFEPIEWDSEPLWMQETEWGMQEYDAQMEQDVQEGLRTLGQMLSNGLKGLRYIIKRFR